MFGHSERQGLQASQTTLAFPHQLSGHVSGFCECPFTYIVLSFPHVSKAFSSICVMLAGIVIDRRE